MSPNPKAIQPHCQASFNSVQANDQVRPTQAELTQIQAHYLFSGLMKTTRFLAGPPLPNCTSENTRAPKPKMSQAPRFSIKYSDRQRGQTLEMMSDARIIPAWTSASHISPPFDGSCATRTPSRPKKGHVIAPMRPTAPGGLRQRDERPLSSSEYVIADKPLTTVKRIEHFLDTTKGNLGCEKARSTLRFVRDGSRSPMESALAISLGLPRNRGGFGLGIGQMNHAVRIFNGADWAGERRYVTRYPDISIEHGDSSGRKTTVGIDYDGHAFHSTAAALARDARRRNEIAPIRGFTHLSINAQEATDFIAFCRFADQTRRALGIRSLDRCPRNNPTVADLEKRNAIERKQLDLWRKLICQSDFRRIE